MPQSRERKREYNKLRNRRLRAYGKRDFGDNTGERYREGEYEGGRVGEGVVPVVPEQAIWRALQELQNQVTVLQQRATVTEVQMTLLEAMVRQAEEWTG